MRRGPALCLLGLLGCAAGSRPETAVVRASPATVSPRIASRVVVLGTNDLHGHLEALPLLGGYFDVVRAQAAADGAVVVPIDAGDMFQGTLPSNMVEGASVIEAYNLLGYRAAAVGNHEFDFGPEGPALFAAPGSDDDPRGALRARARQAHFPLLLANAGLDAARAEALLEPVRASAAFTVEGVRIGVVGVSTEQTAATTLRRNVQDLDFSDPAAAVRREASRLRADGAEVVIVAAHAGSRCARFTGDFRADACEPGGEIVAIAEAVPAGLVDVYVAGHTHAGVAHRVNGAAIIESFSYGRGFGRVDLQLGPGAHGRRVKDSQIHAPRLLCAEEKAALDVCVPDDYAGQKVLRNAAVASLVRPYEERSRARREQLLGTLVTAPLLRDYGQESALGNLFADLLREHTRVDVALMNGGGLRADWPAGELRYGSLFEAMPFDNHVATVRVSAHFLRDLFARNLASSHGILSVSGLTVRALCKKSGLEVQLLRLGKPVADTEELTLAASDYLLDGGGDDFWTSADGQVSHPPVEVHEQLLRDVLESRVRLRARVDPQLLRVDGAPRVDFRGSRPVHCARRATNSAVDAESSDLRQAGGALGIQQ